MYPRINDPENYMAALYLRLSKEDEKKDGKYSTDVSQSIANQRVLLEDYAQQEKLAVFSVYIDDGISGTTFDREDWKRLIADIEAGNVNMVITKDMSRLGRDYIEVGHYMERYFPENGVRYLSLLDGIDTGVESTNNDISPFRAIMNDMYAKDISKKITAVKRDKQDKGLFIGGKPAYGYKKHPTELNAIVIDEPAAENVRKIFAWALEGKSCREIAIILNEKKVPPPAAYAGIQLNEKRKGPYSGQWSTERVNFMLQNEVYTGKMVQGRVKKVNYKSKKCIKLPPEEWKVRDGTHEPLIDCESFEKVGLLIQSRKRTRERTHDYLLKGLTHCHECGHTLGVIMRKLAGDREMLYFVCRTYQRFTHESACTCHCVQVGRLTDAVLEQVREICNRYIAELNIDKITDEAERKMLAERKRQRKNTVDIRAALETINMKIDRVYDDRLSGMIAEEDYQRNYKRLKEEQAALQAKAQTMDDSEETSALDRKKVEELIRKFLITEQPSRELIVSLIERIELSEDKEVSIFFRFKELDSIA